MSAPRKRSGVLTCESCRKFFQSHTERVSLGKAVQCVTGMIYNTVTLGFDLMKYLYEKIDAIFGYSLYEIYWI